MLAWFAVVALTIAGAVVGLGIDQTRHPKKAVKRPGPAAAQTAVSNTGVMEAGRDVRVRVGPSGPGILAVGLVTMAAAGLGLLAGPNLVRQSNAAETGSTNKASTPSTSQPKDATTTATTAGTPALGIAAAWPFVSGCPALEEVAMPPGMGKIEDFHAVTDIRQTLTASGAGSWTRGTLYLDLSAEEGQEVEIINIQPHIERRDLASPAWIYRPTDGCGPYDSDRIFNFDLDKPSFADKGLFDSDSGEPPSAETPAEPLGPSFVLADSKHARIRVNASSCHGNYEWNLDVQYATPGSSKIEHKVVGPFQSFGVANNTIVYSGYQDATGNVHIEDESTMTGSESDTTDSSATPFFSC